MKQKDLLKKYWFVLAIAACAIVFVVYYTVEDAKNKEPKIKTAQKDGNYLIYETGDDLYTADELYGSLYDNYAVATVFGQLDKMTLASLYKTTSEMQNIAAANAQFLLSKYSEAAIDKEMRSVGFGGVKGLSDFYIHKQKSTLFARDFFSEHVEDIVKPFVEANGSKVISHILVKVANVEKVNNEDGSTGYRPQPTKEEQAKLNTVLEALKTEEFAKVAAQYSEDTSAANGGSLGYYDKTVGAQYVPEFTAVANTLSEGQVSDVTVTQYGWHILRCDATTVEGLLKEDAFVNKLRSANGALFTKAVYDKATEIGITIEDPSIKEKVEAALTGATEAK